MTNDQLHVDSPGKCPKPPWKKTSQFVGALVIVPLLLFGCVLAGSFMGISGRHASAWRANLFLHSDQHVPETAADVYFYRDFAASEAEFEITDKDFLDWCRSNHWEPKPISNPVKYFYPTWGPEEDDHHVERGYYCNAAGGVLVFDANRSRAAFHMSEFP